MNVQLILIIQSNSVSVSAYGGSSYPLGLLSIVHFNQRYSLLCVIRSTAHNDQHTAYKTHQVLISTNRRICLRFRRSCPVPWTISVSAQSPHIIQSRTLTLSTVFTIYILFSLPSSPENNHHTVSWTLFTYSCRVVYSRTRYSFVGELILLPGEGSFEYVEKPNIVLCFVSRVASKYY